MEITNISQRPSAPAAAWALVARNNACGTPVFTTGLAHAWSGRTDGTISGKDTPAMDAQLTGDVRGVPPRGRPV